MEEQAAIDFLSYDDTLEREPITDIQAPVKQFTSDASVSSFLDSGKPPKPDDAIEAFLDGAEVPELTFDRVIGRLKEESKRAIRSTLTTLSDPDIQKALSYLPHMPKPESEAAKGVKRQAQAKVLESDPAYHVSSGFVEDLVGVFPQIGAAALGGLAAGPAGAAAVMWPQIAGSTYENQVSKGVDPKRAMNAGMINASLQAPLEAIGILKGIKGLKNIATRGRLLQGLINLGQSAGLEWVTEFVQSVPEAATAIWGEGVDKSKTEMWAEFVEQIPEMLKQGAYEGTLAAAANLMLFGAGGTIGKALNSRTPIEAALDSDEFIQESAEIEKSIKDQTREADQFEREFEQPERKVAPAESEIELLNTVGGDFYTMKEMGTEWGGKLRSPQKLYDAGYSVDEVSDMTPLERAKIYRDLEESGRIEELSDLDSQVQFNDLRKEAVKDEAATKELTTKERRAAPYAAEFQPARIVNTNEEIAQASKDLGPIIKHRKTQYKKRDGSYGTVTNQPMFRDELKNQKKIQEIPGVTWNRPLGGWLETAPRTFEQMGAWAKEFYYRSILRSSAKADKEIKQYRNRVRKLQKSLPKESGERIGAYAISRQHRGKDILKMMDTDVPTLTDKEMKVYYEIRNDLNRFYNQIQKARRMSGKRPFPKQDNYFTFMRKLTLLERMGFSPIDVNPKLLSLHESDIAGMEKIGYNPRAAKKIEKQLKERARDPYRIPISEYAKQFIKAKTIPFKYERARAKAGTMPVELDAFKVLDRYSTTAAKHIHLSPTLSKLRESLLEYKPKIVGKKGAWQLVSLETGQKLPEVYKTKKEAQDAADGKSWALADHAPRAAKFISDWLNDVSGSVTPSKVLPATAERALRKLNENMLYSYLSWSARSAAIQPSALRGALTELGLTYTSKGFADLFSPSRVRFALENSNHLSSRVFDAMVEDMHSLLKRGKIGEGIRKVGKTGMGVLQWLDMATAIATWNASHTYATNKLGLTGDQAINFADDMTIKTQASAAKMDRSPAQRTLEGKLLSMFQTFTINEWNWITRDVLGIGNPNVSNKEAATKVTMLILSTMLFNWLFEDVLGMDSPFPTPIRAFRDARAQGRSTATAYKDAANELIQQLPFLGGLRYGSGIGPPAGKDINNIIKGWNKLSVGDKLSYDERKALESLFKVLGIPMTSQTARSFQAYMRGEGTWGTIAGTYTPEYEQTREQKRLSKQRKRGTSSKSRSKALEAIRESK